MAVVNRRGNFTTQTAANMSVAESTLCVASEPLVAVCVHMPAGTIKRIHVNQHIIRANKAKDKLDAPLTIKWRGKTYPAMTVDINGPSKVVYAPEDPLNCGAHVWVETTAEVVTR